MPSKVKSSEATAEPGKAPIIARRIRHGVGSVASSRCFHAPITGTGRRLGRSRDGHRSSYDGPTAELSDLVEAARQPESDRSDEPPPAPRPFSALVEKGKAVAAEWWEAGGPSAEGARWWARWVVADPSDEAAVDDLARRRLTAICIESAIESPRDVLDHLVIQGEGAELLGRPEAAATVAYLPSGIRSLLGVAAACGSPLFMADKRPGPAAQAEPQGNQGRSRPATPEFTEWLGIRWVGPERRYDVLRELLAAGEKCLLPLLQPAQAEGTLFGRPVCVSDEGARLAVETGSPLVLATGSYDDSGCAVHVSGDLARESESAEELLELVLKTAEEQLEGDPGRLGGALMFPVPELIEWRARAEALKYNAELATEAVWQTRDAYDEQIAAIGTMRDKGADEEEIRAAMVLAEEARLHWREARQAVGVAKAGKTKLPRPERRVRDGVAAAEGPAVGRESKDARRAAKQARKEAKRRTKLARASVEHEGKDEPESQPKPETPPEMSAEKAADRLDRELEVRARNEFFQSAGDFASHLGVETGHGSYVVATSDHQMGQSLFVKRGRPEFRVLERAVGAVEILCEPAPGSDRLFIDVGANIGTTTVSALRVNGFSTAVSCEPQPSSFRLLSANVALNELDEQVVAIEAGISDSVGTMRLVTVEGTCNSWVATSDEVVAAAQEARTRLEAANPGQELPAMGVDDVPVLTLDRLVEDGTIDLDLAGLLWIDAEGHEGHILRGATRLVETGVPMVFEFDPPNLEGRGDRETVHTVIEECYSHYVDLRRQWTELALPRFALRPVRELREYAERFLDPEVPGSFTDLLVLRLDSEQASMGDDLPRLLKEHRAPGQTFRAASLLVTDRFVFLHIPKTGGSFVQAALRAHLPFDEASDIYTHAPYSTLPERFHDRPVLCVIRNPWDWYVSWYFWSLEWGRRLGGRSAAESPEKQAIWEGALRSGRADFREAVTTACTAGFDHPLTDLMREEGFDLYSAHVQDIAGDVFDRPDFTALRFERMKKQLIRYLDEHGAISPTLRRAIRRDPPVRKSTHDPYATYYDSDLRGLVGEKTAWLRRRFNYRLRDAEGPDSRR